MKNLTNFLILLALIIFIISTNLFLKINSDLNHIIGININLLFYLVVTAICIFTVNRIFKKSKLSVSKNYRRDMKITFANSFFASSIISIVSACLIYGFLEKILEKFNISEGLINYTVFSAKIWFISSPFIGLEVTVFRYFYEIEYFKKPIKILLLKSLIFLLISVLFFAEKKVSCFIYAKPVCDIIFLFYYTRICFDTTLN